MRILSSRARHELPIIDNIAGGEEHVLYYRAPTTEERQAYEHAKVVRDGEEVEVKVTVAAFDAGLEILTGIRDGDFGRMDENDQAVSISSDQGSENYFEGWKEHVAVHAPDHIIHLGIHVFDRPTSVRRAPKMAETKPKADPDKKGKKARLKAS